MHGQSSLVLLLLVAVFSGISSHDQSCLRTNHSSGMPPTFQDYRSTNLTFDIIPHQHQAIIPSYKLHCHGNITEWGVDVDRANSGDQYMYILDLQVWRPSPTVLTDGSYSLVGNNRFTSVMLSERVARVTPLPQNRIQFQPGDVLGFYVESTRVTAVATRGVVIVNDFDVFGDRGFEKEEVWYAKVTNITLKEDENPINIDVGPNRRLNTFTNAAPVISVSLNTVDSCQPSPTVSIPVHRTSIPLIDNTIVSAIHTLPAQSNIMPSRTSLAFHNLPTSPVQDTKSLPSSTDGLLRITDVLQSSRVVPSSLTETLRPTSVLRLRTESPRPTLQAGSPFINLDLQTIGLIAGAAAFLAIASIILIAIVAFIVYKCNKPRKRDIKRMESMIGNSAYGITSQNTEATHTRTYRHGDTYDYPRFGLNLLTSIKDNGTEVHNGTAACPDNTYTTVMTFTAQKNEPYNATSPTSDASEDFEHSMQINEAYAATPTSIRDFEHSMQINEAYIATPTSVNGGFEQSMYKDDETYENYVATNSNERDEYSYVRHVYR